MAYNASGLRCLTSGMGSGPSIFYYASNDAHGDVDAAGYFADGVLYGMAVGDIVHVVDLDTGTTTTHHVASVNGSAATITAATLA